MRYLFLSSFITILAQIGSISVVNAEQLYNCQPQVSSFPQRNSVTLAEAKQLLLQMDGNQFIYHCMTATQSNVVSGVITYRQRIALPTGAKIEVQLVDVSRADAPAIVLAEQTIITDGQQVPIPFQLTYDPNQVNPRHSYAVQARILINEQLRWINTNRYSVITNNSPTTIEIVVNPVTANSEK